MHNTEEHVLTENLYKRRAIELFKSMGKAQQRMEAGYFLQFVNRKLYI